MKAVRCPAQEGSLESDSLFREREFDKRIEISEKAYIWS
jgi:hypothetical protein